MEPKTMLEKNWSSMTPSGKFPKILWSPTERENVCVETEDGGVFYGQTIKAENALGVGWGLLADAKTGRRKL
jgi:hypothetical protein